LPGLNPTRLDDRSAKVIGKAAANGICEDLAHMARRIGIGLVPVDTVRESIDEHGARYLNRFYTERELRDCNHDEHLVPQRLAARFAAKEAVLKVLRPTEAISWRNIDVVRHEPGWVTVELEGHAAALAMQARLTDFELSITHADAYAAAVVIAELDLAN
jgi:holo-[acyl-carrier protein] synthase